MGIVEKGRKRIYTYRKRQKSNVKQLVMIVSPYFPKRYSHGNM